MSDKKKYYLRGLSIGMIFTALVLMIVFKNNPEELTDKQLAEMADKKGYTLVSKSETDKKPTTQINLEELKKTPSPLPSDTPKPTDDTKPSDAPAPSDTPEPTDTLVPTNTVAPTATMTPTVAPTATTVPTEPPAPTPDLSPTPTVTPIPTPGPETIELTVATIAVYPGETSEIVARKLVEAKIIKDAADFNMYCFKNNAGRSFQIGYFEVNDKMNYNDLIFVFTRGIIRLN